MADTPGIVGQKLANPLQITQTLLAAVEDQHDRFPGRVLEQIFGAQHQGGHIGGVIPHAGGEQLSVPFFHGKVIGIGKNDIGMGGVDRNIIPAVAAKGQYDILRRVGQNLCCALCQQPVPDEGSASLLMVGGSGNGGQLLEQCQVFRVLMGAPLGDRRKRIGHKSTSFSRVFKLSKHLSRQRGSQTGSSGVE